jgi:hypothetical protein
VTIKREDVPNVERSQDINVILLKIFAIIYVEMEL